MQHLFPAFCNIFLLELDFLIAVTSFSVVLLCIIAVNVT